MRRRVVAVARQRGQVDPADEGDLPVHEHEFLVMAVQRPLVVVERAGDARSADELLAHLPHLTAVRMEERKRSAGPGQHAQVDAFGGLGEQLPQRLAVFA
jgi:hypothetical protein